ncbi:MAG: prepilin peptidase [Firmicutes bacterium]|nr:prepilin peptidase [Bacillota bacterium]
MYIFSTSFFFRDAIILLLLLFISIQDLQKRTIPNFLVLLLFFWIFFWQLFSPALPHWSSLAGFLAGGGIFYLIATLSKGGLGGGDIKLMAVLGLAAGWPFVLLVFLLAFISGAAVGLILLLCKKKTWRAALPFAPFISLAFFLTAVWGPEIWQWYISFL